VPAAAVTAYARDDQRQQALAAGFQLHIAKPVDPPQLAHAVASLLRQTAISL
jgi:CheY-like chemotaxis protein